MNGCVGAGPQTEYDFVVSLAGRDLTDDVLACGGPLVALIMDDNRLAQLRSAVRRPSIHTMVQPERHPSGMCRVVLCALHWLRVSREVGMSGLTYQRSDWLQLGSGVIRSMCDAVSWDTKEISNLFHWRGAPHS